MKGISHTLLSYLAAAVFLLAIWWGLALLLELPIVPTPNKVFVRLTDVFARDILEHAAYSSGALQQASAWLSASAIHSASSWATSARPTASCPRSST